MKRFLSSISLAAAALVALSMGTANAFLPPTDGQDRYERSLRTFDLHNYRSAVTDAARAGTESSLARGLGGAWSVYSWNPQSGTPSEIYGSGVEIAGPIASAAGVQYEAERVIEQHPEVFGAELSGLEFRRATSAPAVNDAADGIPRVGKWAAHFAQVYHGIEVAGGEVHLTFTDGGRLFAMGSTYYRDIHVNWTPRISASEAKAIASGSLPFDAANDEIEEEARLLVLPVPVSETRVDHHLVWETRVRTNNPLGRWNTKVDAHSGEILERTNEICFVDYQGSTAGQMERFSYCDGSHQEWYPYTFVSILGVASTYADANSNWHVPYGGGGQNTLYSRLLSPYVEVQNMQGSWAAIFATVTPGVPHLVTFDDSNSRADERDVFRTVSELHDFFQTFAPGFGFSNQLVTARVNINNTCNAFYDNNTINFYQAGSGCGNTGRIMDVVAHEYGHGVQGWILGNGNQGGEGLGEGNGDVLAFLTSGSSIIARGFYNCEFWGGLRDAENELVYPDDVVGQEIHYAGQVIAGFHWDAMQDQLARYGSWGRYSTAYDWHWGRALQLPTTQPAQVLATFIANDDDGNLSNGTPQFNSYCLAAANHGFTCPTALLPLSASACDTYYQGPQGYRINQQNNYWTVVGVAPSAGDDKDIAVYTSGYGTLLASSQGTVGTDFVVGDFNHNALGTYQPYVSYGNTTAPFVTEWDAGADAITVNTDMPGSVGGSGGNCGLVKVWDVFLVAGRTYTMGLLNSGGAADIRMSLFRNPASAPHWAGRSSAALEIPAGGSQLYTAPATDWYGVVVFNNVMGTPPSGSYTIRIQDAPTALASAQCVSASSWPRMFSFNQPIVYWTGVAVNPTGADDKDIAVYADPAAAGPVLASSTGTVGTDFVVGDFNHTPTGTYFARVSYGAANASYVTEWDSGQDAAYVPGDVTGTVGGGSGGCGLIQVTDVFLEEGQQVRFLLETGGSAQIRAALFRNPSDGSCWKGRSGSEFEIGNLEGYTYTAPAADWYGIVVFNNSPGSPGGSFALRLRNLPPALASDGCAPQTESPQYFSLPQEAAYWSAIAVNPSGVDDKDMWLYPTPDGFDSPLAFSTGTEGTDFVVGDFNHNPIGTYFPLVTGGDSPSNYVVRWESGSDLFPLGPPVEGIVGGADGECGLIQVWDVFLEAGTEYPITLSTAGDADIRAALFRNPESAPFWGGRYNSEFEVRAEETPYSYVAPASDYYGLVVFNNSPDSPAGSYTIQIGGAASVGDLPGPARVAMSFQNPYPTGAPIQLQAAADGTGARVDIYNVQGRLVRTLLDGSVGTATRTIRWDGLSDAGSKLGAGVYLVQAQIGTTRLNRRLLMLH